MEKREQKLPIHMLARAAIVIQEPILQLLLAFTADCANPFYFLPGGHIESGETAQTALQRELKEEIGLPLKIERFLGCLEYHFTPRRGVKVCHHHEYNLIFAASFAPEVKGLIDIKSREAPIGLQWVPLSQLERIDLAPPCLKTCLPLWLDGNHQDAYQLDGVDRRER